MVFLPYLWGLCWVRPWKGRLQRALQLPESGAGGGGEWHQCTGQWGKGGRAKWVARVGAGVGGAKPVALQQTSREKLCRLAADHVAQRRGRRGQGGS